MKPIGEQYKGQHGYGAMGAHAREGDSLIAPDPFNEANASVMAVACHEEQSMSEIAHLLALEERRRKAMLAGDGPALRLLLAADLRYVHSTGAVDSYDSLFARLTSAEVVYQHLAFEQLEVTAAGNAGVISGEMHAEIRKGDASRKLASRYLGVWLQRAGAWQFSAFQSTRLSQE